MKDRVIITILFLLSILTFSSLLRSGYFPMHDDMQAMRVLQMDKCIKDGQIPCRWVPDMGYGYGYPQFQYYSPLPYYVMEVFHLIGFSILDSVKIGFIIPTFIALLGMYLLAKELWGRWGGFLSSFLFIFAPYRAVDLYVRGAMGELWALSIIPFVFYGTYKIFNNSSKSKIILGLSLATLFLSHNITTILTVPFLGLWIIYLSFEQLIVNSKIKLKEIFTIYLKIFTSMLIGLGLASFFLLPVIFEKQYAHIDTLVGGYFDYRIHFSSIKQLFYSNFWDYGSSESHSFDSMFLGVGPFYLVFGLLGVFGMLKLKKMSNKNTRYIFLLFLAFASIFMVHSKSSFIWNLFDFLDIVQFPWRFLTFSVFFFSLTAGYAISLLKELSNKLLMTVFIMALIILSYGHFFRPNRWIDINDTQKFSGNNWSLQQTISIFDYLPIYAKYPPSEEAFTLPNSEKGSNWYKLYTNDPYPKSIMLPIYYFPGWKIWVNDKEVDITYENELGLITIEIPAGENYIYAKLTDTPVRIAGNFITAITLFSLIFYVKKLKNEKN